MDVMNRGLATALAFSLLAVPAVAAAPRKVEPAVQLMQSCDAHKFETVVTATVDGQPRQSKIKLCGNKGQSDAEWIKTLRDAIRKLDADKQMDPAVRSQIKTAINAEIGQLTIEAAVPGEERATAVAAAPPALPAPRRPADAPTDRDFATLPPLPTSPPPPPHVLPTTIAGAAPMAGIPAVSAAPPPVFAAPRLTFACYSPGDIGGDGPCAEFDRETMLTVKAGDKVPAGVTLRFVRNGEGRADVDLASLSSGRSMRMALPRDVCAGFGAGQLELQVIENGAVVSSDGPYALRCY